MCRFKFAFDAGRDGAVSGGHAPVVELDPLIGVECARHRLTQFFIGSHDGVVKVEADIISVEAGLRLEDDSSPRHFFRECAVRVDDGVPVVA